jgi:hypothetical protein
MQEGLTTAGNIEGFFIFRVPEVPVPLRMKVAGEGYQGTGRYRVDGADEAW